MLAILHLAIGIQACQRRRRKKILVVTFALIESKVRFLPHECPYMERRDFGPLILDVLNCVFLNRRLGTGRQ
jgi:hypothetical protein